jgi:magnesium transporter
MADLKGSLLPPKPASAINLRDSSYRLSVSGRQPFQGVDICSRFEKAWPRPSVMDSCWFVRKFHSQIIRVDLPARDLRLLDPLLVYPSTILGREKAMVVNLEQIRCIITADEVLLPDSLDSHVLQYVVELQGRLMTPGLGDVWQSEGAELNRRRSRNFDNVFGNIHPLV